MTLKKQTEIQQQSKEKLLLDKFKGQLLDPLARELISKVQWFHLKGLSQNVSELYPIAITGKGSPVLLLHGFDSSFLEFRRLVPYLSQQHQLLIPDLYGFGFCPRPKDSTYGLEKLMSHLIKVLTELPISKPVGVIGASMGGAIAMKLARHQPNLINRLLLLSPAGLTSHQRPVPRPLDQIGVWFLSQPKVRKSLCRQAFADPNKSVGAPEEQIASLHLAIPGWKRSLAAFARSGGVGNCGKPLPPQPLHVIWGSNDRILQESEKTGCKELLGNRLEEITNCGHLPHLDQPKIVAERWLNYFQ